MKKTKIAILHYSSPPVVGGVEAVIDADARQLTASSFTVTVISGRGDQKALPAGTEFKLIPELDSGHPRVLQANQELEHGRLPPIFEELTEYLEKTLADILPAYDYIIADNLFSKHFNLPLTAALCRLLDNGYIQHCIAWTHDISWTSQHSRSLVSPGYPWNLLRTYRPDVCYVVVSQRRQRELARLLEVPLGRIHLIYNGVDPVDLLGLSDEGKTLIERLELWRSDLILLMPVRMTQAKNIELAIQVTAALKDRGFSLKMVVTGPPDPHDKGGMEYYQSLRVLRRRLQVEQEMRFVYEFRTSRDRTYTISSSVVGDLLRVSDAIFMPSHREGFGMPLLEAGLVGIPVFCTHFPAADEIGAPDIYTFSPESSVAEVVDLIEAWSRSSSLHRLRQRIRQTHTWQAIFQRDISPLIMKRNS